MSDMTQRKPDSAKPSDEPASARRSPVRTPAGRLPGTLESRFGHGACGHEQKRNVNEQKWRGWARWVVGDRRVGRVDEVSRETPGALERRSWPQSPKNRPRGVRASVVAMKRGNAQIGRASCR